MEKEVRQRVNDFMLANRLTGTKLAELLDMKRGTLQSKLNGTNNMDIDTICRIANVFGDLSMEWLIRGKDMNHSNSSHSISATAHHNSNASVNINTESAVLQAENAMLRERVAEQKQMIDTLTSLLRK